MGSHIPIRQLRRSSVNARPRGTTLRSLVVSVVFTNTCATSFPSLPILCFEAFPRCSSTTVGLRPLSRDISSGFSDSLFFPSALFNSLVRRLGGSSGTYSLEAGPGPVTNLRQFTGQRKRAASSDELTRVPRGAGVCIAVSSRARIVDTCFTMFF